MPMTPQCPEQHCVLPLQRWESGKQDAARAGVGTSIVNLGKDDGLDLLAWMRQKPETREIPVIAVTAHALVAEQQRILYADCRMCLSKPIDFQLLRVELNRRLEDSKTQQMDP